MAQSILLSRIPARFILSRPESILLFPLLFLRLPFPLAQITCILLKVAHKALAVLLPIMAPMLSLPIQTTVRIQPLAMLHSYRLLITQHLALITVVVSKQWMSYGKRERSLESGENVM
jgi:hypothetical protein